MSLKIPQKTISVSKSTRFFSVSPHILLITLTLISSVFIIKEVILPNMDLRIQFENDILSNRMEPPYQYRILKPLLARFIQTVVSPIVHSARTRHLLSYSAITVLTFLGIFYLFRVYLRRFFSEKTSVIGVLLLSVVIPLATTGYYMIGDFITVLFYISGFLLFLKGKDYYLPLLIGLAAFNREQAVFLILFYVIYLYSEKRLTRKREISIIAASIIAFLVVFLGIRFYFGFKPDQYSVALHVARNLAPENLFVRIIPLWLAEFAGFLILSLYSFRKCNRFFKISLACLGSYIVLFLLKGNLWEMAKFLPAYLILIPMSLQTLFGEKTAQKLGER